MNNFSLLTSSKTLRVKQRDVRNSKVFNQAQNCIINPRSLMEIMQQDKYKKHARKYEKTQLNKTKRGVGQIGKLVAKGSKHDTQEHNTPLYYFSYESGASTP